MNSSLELRRNFLNLFIKELIKTYTKQPLPRVQETQINIMRPRQLIKRPRIPPPKAPPIKKIAVKQIQQLKSLIMPINLGKLNALLSDKAVLSIECTGPAKPILINKSGTIQTTNVSLNENEIKKVIFDFAEKTRIPIEGGVFRASLDGISISAVISEFVGTRFVIEKSYPSQK